MFVKLFLIFNLIISLDCRPDWVFPSARPRMRISASKCEEYQNYTMRRVRFGGLSLYQPAVHEARTSTCDLSAGLIVNGIQAKDGDFPHVGNIGYRDEFNQVQFICGGSLISERFVLTAAHCEIDRLKTSGFVRFGAVDIDSSRAMDYSILDFIPHENYSYDSKENDIAVIKLKRNVTFRLPQGVRPTCLWQTDTISSTNTIAVGWGTTSYLGAASKSLMKVLLNILDTQKCVDRYVEDDPDIVIDRKHICAGVTSGGKDTCQGDSGAPIHVVLPDNKCIAHIIGVTSYGGVCGGEQTAAVYTRVSSHLDWIEKKVWG